MVRGGTEQGTRTCSAGVAYSIIVVVALVVLILLYSGFTGYVSLDDSSVEGSDKNVKLKATVTNDDETRDSVWGGIWDSTGGLVWMGLLAIVGVEQNREDWEVVISKTSPPFPNLDNEENFDYTIYANDSSGYVVNLSGSFVLGGEKKKVYLKKGWNMVSFISPDSVYSETDREITINMGWNLVGYSSDFKDSNKDNMLIDNRDFDNAVSRGLVQNMFAHYDVDSGKYKMVSSDEGFKSTKAYWVYSNSKTPKEIKFKGVGGDDVGEKILLSRLILTYEETGVSQNYVDMLSEYNFRIQYYDSVDKRFKDVLRGGEIESWKGYFIYSPDDDFSISID